MRLSPHFRLEEFTHSEVAGVDLEPTKTQIWLLEYLCKNVLESIRVHFNKPIQITSGLRDRQVYNALKERAERLGLAPPSPVSDHFAVSKFRVRCGKMWTASDVINPRGRGAADFVIHNMDMWDVFYWIVNKWEHGKYYNQAIMYDPKYSKKVKTQFIHIANPSHIFPPPLKNSWSVKRQAVYVGSKYVRLIEFEEMLAIGEEILNNTD